MRWGDTESQDPKENPDIWRLQAACYLNEYGSIQLTLGLYYQKPAFHRTPNQNLGVY